jgi:hypothetical protein
MDPKPDDFREPSAEPPPTRSELLVPGAAVLAVAVAALAATLMSKPDDAQDRQRLATAPVARQEVVQAPPLDPTATMGGAPACQNCGVVESVAAAPNKRFQMRIRMQDGSLRTMEQRGALPAGSRVTVEGEQVRLMPG